LRVFGIPVGGNLNILVAVSTVAIALDRESDDLVAIYILIATCAEANLKPGALSGMGNTFLYRNRCRECEHGERAEREEEGDEAARHSVVREEVSDMR